MLKWGRLAEGAGFTFPAGEIRRAALRSAERPPEASVHSDDRRQLRLLFWESTAACNLRCAHCRRLEQADSAGEDLTTAEARRLIESAAALGRPIFVFSGGEPLLREDWESLAGYAREAALPTALATNATLIDAALAGRIGRAGFHRVSVSLDAPDAQLHDAFRGPRGAFDAATRGISALRRAGVAVQINSTIFAGNADCLEGLYDLAVRLGAAALHLFILVPVGCGLELAQSQQLSAERCERVLEWVVGRQAAGGIELKATCAPQHRRVAGRWLKDNPDGPGAQRVRAAARGRGCLAGSGVIFVSHAGEVFPCGYMPVPCGSIRRQPLEEVWDSSLILAELRDDDLLAGKCGACEYRGVCGGCRARAYAATGEWVASDPLCGYLPGRE